MNPTDRKYTKEHEWVQETPDGVKVGITQHAQEAMGDIVFVDLPPAGASFNQGDDLIVIESVKAVSNIYSPVAGEVIAVNEALDGEPELLNHDPYGQYLVIFQPGSEVSADLMSAAEYDAFVSEQG